MCILKLSEDLKEAAVLQRLKRGRDLLKNRLKEDGLWEE